MKCSLFYAQVVAKTANLVFHIVVQGSEGQEIIVLNYVLDVQHDYFSPFNHFPIRSITLVICCCGRCLIKGPLYYYKSRVRNHFPVLFYSWTSCIVCLSYLLLSHYIYDWESKPSIYFRRKKKRRKASAILKHWSRITNQTEKPRSSFILFVIVIHSCFNIHINKVLNQGLEVQQKRKNKNEKQHYFKAFWQRITWPPAFLVSEHGMSFHFPLRLLDWT